MGHILQCQNWHLNQLKPRNTNEIKSQQRNVLMEILYDIFDLSVGIINTHSHRLSKRKRNIQKMLELNLKKENTYSKKNVYLKTGGVV